MYKYITSGLRSLSQEKWGNFYFIFLYVHEFEEKYWVENFTEVYGNLGE